MLVTFGICFKQHCDTRYLVFYNLQLETGQRISAETCGLDDAFPPDDLCSGPYAQFITEVIGVSSFLEAYAYQ